MSPRSIRSMFAGSPRRGALIASTLFLAAGSGGCASDSGGVDRPISLSDFVRSEESLRAAGLEVSTHRMPSELSDPDGSIATEVVRAGDEGTSEASAVRSGGRDVSAATPSSGSVPPSVRVVDPSVNWPVDALVGQINGRPIFANEFFEPIAEELVAAASNPDRAVGRQQFIGTVKAFFKRTVDNELIVAEAESQLSPEQQEGLLAWIRSIQEETIAERGGSRAAAEASLASEEDKSLDEFLAQRRDVALAMRLLNQRIEPRAIVSWREVLQAYERDAKIYNPPRQIRIGRIQLDSAADAERIARVEAMVAEGKVFSEIVRELGLADGGLWQSSDLPADGIEGLPLTDAVKTRIKDLPVDRVSPSLQQRGFTSWFAVIAIDQPVARTVYDRELQLAITEQLRDIRRTIERQRYISTLRSRWVTDDISDMEERLVAFALERYWR